MAAGTNSSAKSGRAFFFRNRFYLSRCSPICAPADTGCSRYQTPTRSIPRPRRSGTIEPGARSRGGRPVVGSAVRRTGPISPLVIAPYSFLPYRTGLFYGRSVGLNPFRLYGYPSFATGYMYAWPDYYPAEYGLYDAPAAYAPDPFDRSGATGKLRLRVDARDADVYVDGYYAGIVDDFDGHFQRLTLTAGPHHVEIRAAGYPPLIVDVMIEPGRTTDYRGALQR